MLNENAKKWVKTLFSGRFKHERDLSQCECHSRKLWLRQFWADVLDRQLLHCESNNNSTISGDIEMLKRKVVQISSIAETVGSYSQLFALCNDGTIWVKDSPGDEDESYWKYICDIPDDPGPKHEYNKNPS
jgi:hypothetical protein